MDARVESHLDHKLSLKSPGIYKKRGPFRNARARNERKRRKKQFTGLTLGNQ